MARVAGETHCADLDWASLVAAGWLPRLLTEQTPLDPATARLLSVAVPQGAIGVAASRRAKLRCVKTMENKCDSQSSGGPGLSLL